MSEWLIEHWRVVACIGIALLAVAPFVHHYTTGGPHEF